MGRVLGFAGCWFAGEAWVRITNWSGWRGLPVAVLALLPTACSLLDPSADATRCGGSAYDSIMFNSDRYNAGDRYSVVSLLRSAPGGEVSAEVLERVSQLTGERDARRIVDEFGSCLRG